MPGAGRCGKQHRADQRDQTEHRFDRQANRLAVDQNRNAAQFPEPRRLQGQEGSVDDEKVMSPNSVKICDCRRSVFQNTSA